MLVESSNMLRKRKYFKQYSILAISNIGTLGIAFLSNILVTQILTEADYGSYKYILNIITMVVSFANLGIYYSTARLLTKANEEETKELYGATISLMLIITILSATIVGIGYLIVYIFNPIKDIYILVALPFIYTVMLQRTFVSMLKGSNRINDLAIQTFIPQVLILLIYGLIFISNENIQMQYIQAVVIYGLVFAMTHIFTIIRLKVKLVYGIKTKFKDIITEQKQNGFQIYKGSLVGVFTADFLSVIVGTISKKSEFATYALATSLSAPILQIPAMLGVVLYKKNALSKKIKKKQLYFTFLMTLGMCTIWIVVIHVLFPIIYKDRFAGTVEYTIFLTIRYSIHGLGDYFNNFLSGQGLGSKIKIASIIGGVTQLLLAALFIPWLEIKGLVISQTVSSIVYFVCMFYFYLKYIKK
jgi:O-antigen/teichoic acid export membrane protein